MFSSTEQKMELIIINYNVITVNIFLLSKSVNPYYQYMGNVGKITNKMIKLIFNIMNYGPFICITSEQIFLCVKQAELL